ncbi:hypothetical protein AB0J82_36750 [Asanoa sp. NPDC049518]|uniref:hypothetical protein n=1 Tax=unclassified Asanoa TaxID=2685164 RepID=UPI003441C0E6
MFDTIGCACAITCATQPTTLLAINWNCALFRHPDTGHLWFVNSLGSGQWDWESANEIDPRADQFAAAEVISDHLDQITYLLTT